MSDSDNSNFLDYPSDVIFEERQEILRRRGHRTNFHPNSLVESDATYGTESSPATRPSLEQIVKSGPRPPSEEIKEIYEALGDKGDTKADDVLANVREALQQTSVDSADRPLPIKDAMGLCLSGGGIRSASFALGCVQALQRYRLFEHMDYLSTVSGGGYVGASLSAAISDQTALHVPEKQADDTTEPSDDAEEDVAESQKPLLAQAIEHKPGLPEGSFFRHLRNNADFLASRNAGDTLLVMLRVLMGAIYNSLIFLSLLAVLTLGLGSLLIATGSIPTDGQSGYDPFLSLYAAIGILAVGLIGTVWSRITNKNDFRKIQSTETDDLGQVLSGNSKPNFLGPIKAVIRYGTLAFVGLSLAMIFIDTLFASAFYLLDLFRSLDFGTPLNLLAGGYSSLVALVSAVSARKSSVLEGVGQKNMSGGLKMLASVFGFIIVVFVLASAMLALEVLTNGSNYDVLPALSLSLATEIALVALGFLIFSVVFYNINTHSLHPFYRDRLRRAFVFKLKQNIDGRFGIRPAHPKHPITLSSLKAESLGDRIGRKADSSKSPVHHNIGPYPIINAAINLHKVAKVKALSDKDPANMLREEREPEESFSDVSSFVETVVDESYKKGRRADFFTFSPLYCGSKQTGYLKTQVYEDKVRINLATAIAISGAAVSAHAGKRVPALLAPLLAMANARMNVWLRSPRTIFERETNTSSKLLKTLFHYPNAFTLLREIFPSLHRLSNLINVSDGGHIENLGLHEMLRRRCSFIVVCDAGEDKDLSFGDFSEAVRIAQIDLGIRVEMDGLDDIRAGEQGHAVGTIYYGEKENEIEGERKREPWIGKLLYLKLCLPGDYALEDALGREAFLSSPRREDNDLYDTYSYIASHAAKNPSFPFDSTADQFFDEEQFEAYRALGFRITSLALSG